MSQAAERSPRCLPPPTGTSVTVCRSAPADYQPTPNDEQYDDYASHADHQLRRVNPSHDTEFMTIPRLALAEVDATCGCRRRTHNSGSDTPPPKCTGRSRSATTLLGAVKWIRPTITPRCNEVELWRRTAGCRTLRLSRSGRFKRSAPSQRHGLPTVRSWS